MENNAEKSGLKVESLRRMIILVLTLAVLIFASGTFLMLQRIFDNFGPGVLSDLQWKAQRGASEIARTAELGLAIDDKGMVEDAITDFKRSDDILAIVAVNAAGESILTFGSSPIANEALFAARPGTIESNDEYIFSWSPAYVEANTVGSVAVVVTTKRLVESQSLLQKVQIATALAGLLALFGGIGFVVYFTRAILARDRQLAAYAAGLEQMVAQRTEQLDKANLGMRVVLDNVAQGLATLDLDGKLAPESSAMVRQWFGDATKTGTFQELIAPIDSKISQGFEIGLEQVRDGFLPTEVALDQMPKRIRAGDRDISLSYTPIGNADASGGLLLVASDITEQLAHERAEKEQRQTMRIFQRISHDRDGVADFVSEAELLVQEVVEGAEDAVLEKRLVHTIKGNCALFDIGSIAELCHELESNMEEAQRGLTPAERELLRAQWERTANEIRKYLGRNSESALQISADEHVKLLKMLESKKAGDEIVRWVRSWTMDPIGARLRRFGEQAQRMATEQGKAPIDLHVDDAGTRLDATAWSPFWHAFAHLVRNAVDHGIETIEERQRAGKPETATMRLEIHPSNDSLELRFEDDGRGINWDKVAVKAQAAGLASLSQQDLESALFHDGVSTRDGVSLTSGRGVGLAAVKAAAEELHGNIRIESTLGAGTAFIFTFPRNESVFAASELIAA